ncbi:MAG: TonB-dependent receptor, partial [Flavobacteriales bacterium]|nr:TonB-dependent receptor [Flavobacteriales bacterium]
MKSLALLFGMAAAIHLQAQHLITGTITDGNAQPLEFVNVLLLNAADSAMVKGAVTDATGRYEFESVNAGSYMVKCMIIGFETNTTETISLSDKNVELPPIALTGTATEVGEVQVAAIRPMIEVKPDMTVFNVENTINSTGNTALELLRKSPGVTVDNNNNVMLKGRQGVQIWIDGKPAPLDGDALAAMLQNMQSSEIAAIELISNPGAKYDAAGTAGIINIRLKKNKNFGTNGTFGLGVAYGLHLRENGTLSINHRNEKINAFGNYSTSSGKSENYMNLYRRQNGSVFDQETVMLNNDIPHGFKAGLDYFISRGNTIGVVARGNISTERGLNNSRTLIGPESGSEIEKVLVSDVVNNGDRKNASFNLNYMHTDTLGKTLKVDLDYGIYRINALSDQPNSYLDPSETEILEVNNYRTSSPTEIDIYSAKLDYDFPILKGQLAVGTKISNVETANTFDFYNIDNSTAVLDSSRSNFFSYTENIAAAYLTYQRQLGKTGIQAGLRGELTRSKGALEALVQEDETNDTSYFNIFPSVSVSYNPSEMHGFVLSYSRRIDRPSYQDLNPFEYKLDELTYQKGNPFLRPQYTHNIELSHTLMYMYTTSLTYAYTTDFSTMNIYADGDASYISQTNLGKQQYAALSISAPVEIKKWWSIYLNATGYYQQTNANLDDGRKIDLDFISFNMYAQSSWMLPKDYSVEISGWYNGPGLWGGSFKNSALGSLDVGAKKTWKDGRVTLRLSYTDLLRTAHWRGVSNVGSQYMDARGGWESYVLRMDLSIKFGNQQIKI